MTSNRNVLRFVAAVTASILALAVAWIAQENRPTNPGISPGVSMESIEKADGMSQTLDAVSIEGWDGAEAAAEAVAEAVPDVTASNPREFLIALKTGGLVYGAMTVPDGWHSGPSYTGVIIRNIPLDEVSYGGGVAVVRLTQPNDHSARSGVDPTDLLSTRSVNIGGSTITQRMGTVPPESAPLSGGANGEMTYAVVVDSEGQELLQVVTFIQGTVSAEEKSAIEAVFADVLASVETHYFAGRDSGLARQEIYISDWRVAGWLPSDWSMSAIEGEAIDISGPGVAGDEIGITLTRVDEAGPELATNLDAAYDIGSTLMSRDAPRVPGAEQRFLLLDRPGEGRPGAGYPGGPDGYWDMRFRSASPEDTAMLFAVARGGAIDRPGQYPFPSMSPTPGPDSYPAPYPAP